MKKGRNLLIYLLVCVFFLCGCGEAVNQGNPDWIPSQTVTDMKDDTADDVGVIEEHEYNVHSIEELCSAMLQDELTIFADMLWDNQRANGLFHPQISDKQGRGILEYYVSSSEGDDKNNGLSPNAPKKTLNGLSGISNIKIYLKTDDIFFMDKSFSVGENVLFTAYGIGKRPELNFFQVLEGQWEKASGYSQVWTFDLTVNEEIFHDLNNSEDCNIGQLFIDGESNWKRKESTGEESTNYGKYLAETKDGSWAVDWENGILYIYSTKNPNQMQISYAYPGHALSISNVDNVCVSGIEITGAGFHGISISNAEDIKITNCYIHNIGGGMLKKTGTRYGNAIEVWDTGKDVEVAYNVADWIYDTCYTNQGSLSTAVQSNVEFHNNVGSHCFWGLEMWGDGFADEPFEKIVYRENILLNACDVTAEAISYHINEWGQRLSQENYITYRSGDYAIHRMALLNSDTCRNKESLLIENNIFFGTNRFMHMLNMGQEGYPLLKDNVFMEDEYPEGTCLYRYTDPEGTIHYLAQLPMEIRNDQIVILSDDVEARTRILKDLLGEIANGEEE